MPTPLSVLDLAPIPSGGTASDALRNTLDLARRAEQLGYRRYWVAEHHLTPGVASAAPAVLIALISGATSRIRVGSAAVLLGHHSPLVVAEEFGTIAHLHPGRVDLGLGRVASNRAADLARRFAEGVGAPSRVVDGLLVPAKPKGLARSEAQLARIAEQQRLVGRPVEGLDYRTQVGQVLQYVTGGLRDSAGEPLHAQPAEGADLDVWVLGSSAGESSATAGALGLPYAANYHVSPSTVLESVSSYRDGFTASTRLARPYVAVSADVVVAGTDEAARELAAPHARWVHSIRAGAGAIPYPSPAEAAAFPWTDQDRELVADRVATQFVGAPETVVRGLATLRDVTGADELVVTTITHDHADRVRSYELLAEAWQASAAADEGHGGGGDGEELDVRRQR
ncbi:MsnO8 family LLM class oxidoreductase [Saccharopolyspora hordei]|uniref:Alkanesulfonate monooxygenase SsuD/methylene tetrahydromethanopterin reductase-like flavin-dependent oxidoreductase (Luciferase family) n=1 Tax=Saccharopolyspora hordei TaxID=1838 RepID=A0A853ALQ3_9PSEU|nr:MsnO8 family LLM class oxidoreductase [Saccharopolyspora hordei]NYI85005.1 alkanesulfonate monooxygenase SsuD/methylene tetrahydromethanopterin reductase-like flavin-dependent oxidoreductase (luciferase family) [Saccharopolyspora hordei]